jgi:tRNA dimethylallyltransferase
VAAKPVAFAPGRSIAYALLGPTASGKSRLAMELAARHALEIVSVDSAQVYRGMDIGTAKPSTDERRAVPHYLIDIVDPTQSYSAGRFREDALRAIADIHARGKIPFLVGGTMLYYRALSEGMDELPQANPEIRRQIDAEAAQKGWPTLYAELAAVDPKTAARLQPGDAQRIQRALEVHRTTGRPISDFQNRPKPGLPFELRSFSLVPEDRSALHQRIAARFDAMLQAGLTEELAALRKRYALNPALPSMRCVGYRQAWEFLDGSITASQLRESGIAATRQLAKRQFTWLRSLPGLEPADRLADVLSRG